MKAEAVMQWKLPVFRVLDLINVPVGYKTDILLESKADTILLAYKLDAPTVSLFPPIPSQIALYPNVILIP